MVKIVLTANCRKPMVVGLTLTAGLIAPQNEKWDKQPWRQDSQNSQDHHQSQIETRVKEGALPYFEACPQGRDFRPIALFQSQRSAYA